MTSAQSSLAAVILLSALGCVVGSASPSLPPSRDAGGCCSAATSLLQPLRRGGRRQPAPCIVPPCLNLRRVASMRGGSMNSIQDQLEDLYQRFLSSTDAILAGSGSYSSLTDDQVPGNSGAGAQSATQPPPAQGGWGAGGSQPASSIAGTGGGSYTAVRLPDRESPKDDGAASKFTAYYPTPLTSPPNESRNPIKVLKKMMSPPSPASEPPASVKSPPSPPPAYVQYPSASTCVKFVRKAQVEDGESLYVSGDCAALGEGDISRAVEMTRDFSICQEGHAWSVTVQGVPRETRYRYLVKGGKLDERWQTEYTMPLTVAQAGEGNQQDEAFTQDDTEVLVRFSMTKSGVTSMAVQGSIDCLGNWDPNKALSLERIPGRQRWEKVASIPSHQLYNFEYKYQCVLESRPGQIKVEKGSNRLSDAHVCEPQPESGAQSKRGIVTLSSAWEGLLIRFLIYHPISDPSSWMAIAGSHPALGEWQGQPLRMGLGSHRTLLTGVKGRCWEATFHAAQEDVVDMNYRYLIVTPGQQGGSETAIFEREPNRVIQRLPGAVSCSNVVSPGIGVPGAQSTTKGYRQREVRFYDGNFVFPGLEFDFVPDVLAIGPYPQTAEDVRRMKVAGITGVLNVQTDQDHKNRMVDWSKMEELYKEAGIDVVRVPIEDFNGVELSRLMRKGVDAVDELVNREKAKGGVPRVYIHCTAGMGRAPAVACVYLVKHGGYTGRLSEALAHVKAHRKVAAPNEHSMEVALKNWN